MSLRLLIIFGLWGSVLCELGSYKAAVVEYASIMPTVTSPRDIIAENIREYQNKIEDAASQDAQIIVFPEYGLQNSFTINHENVEAYSTLVPHPSEKIIVCTNSTNIYADHLIKLSCSARQHKIYTVVNLAERATTSNRTEYYNTNVVFDKNGMVIARYRKINLYDEPYMAAGNEVVTFKTDFGVTFGLLICFDVLFKKPAITVLEDAAVTDIILPSAWMSETPFLVSLSAHTGYARENGVNLLAAGLNSPAIGHGGSGIFFGNGQVAESYISGVRGTKMIVQKVPIISKRYQLDTCSISQPASPKNSPQTSNLSAQQPTIANLNTTKEDMRHYSYKNFNASKEHTVEQLCSHNSGFCCNFTITMDAQTTSTVKYKLVAFHGVRPCGNTTMGLRTCGIVACLNDTLESCGERPQNPPALLFRNITINFIAAKTQERDSRPSSLLHRMTPVEDYAFCSKEIDNDQVETTMYLRRPQDGLLSFGIYGRVYDQDNNTVGPSTSSAKGSVLARSHVYTILLVVASLFYFSV